MFTHILNPFQAAPGSGHDLAQRLTFAAVGAAASRAQSQGIPVKALGITYPEDAGVVPDHFVSVSQLQRSISDVAPGLTHRRYPLLAELLEAARPHATD